MTVRLKSINDSSHLWKDFNTKIRWWHRFIRRSRKSHLASLNGQPRMTEYDNLHQLSANVYSQIISSNVSRRCVRHVGCSEAITDLISEISSHRDSNFGIQFVSYLLARVDGHTGFSGLSTFRIHPPTLICLHLIRAVVKPRDDSDGWAPGTWEKGLTGPEAAFFPLSLRH